MLASTAIFQAAHRCAGSPRIRPERLISSRWLPDAPNTLRVNSASIFRIQGDRCSGQTIVVTFIHYPHPDNLLPGPPANDSGEEREPDVNILHYDYSVLFVKEYVKWQQSQGKNAGYRPFLSISSTSQVAAGVVAMMRSLRPDLTPSQCKQILQETSRKMDYRGDMVPWVLDAAAAVAMASKWK